MGVKADQNQDKYPTIFKEEVIFSEDECKEEGSSSEDEYKLIGLLQRAPEYHSAPLRIIVQLRRDKKKQFDALLDTGAPKCIVNQSFVETRAKHGYCVEPSTSTCQEVSSSGTPVAQFHFVKLETVSIITHRFQFIEDSKDTMVIGRYLLQTLGLIIKF